MAPPNAGTAAVDQPSVGGSCVSVGSRLGWHTHFEAIMAAREAGTPSSAISTGVLTGTVTAPLPSALRAVPLPMHGEGMQDKRSGA